MILLTGFEPFGGQPTNPSWAAAQSARDLLRTAGAAVEAVQLPCVFGTAGSALRKALDDLAPELVLRRQNRFSSSIQLRCLRGSNPFSP